METIHADELYKEFDEGHLSDPIGSVFPPFRNCRIVFGEKSVIFALLDNREYWDTTGKIIEEDVLSNLDAINRVLGTSYPSFQSVPLFDVREDLREFVIEGARHEQSLIAENRDVPFFLHEVAYDGNEMLGLVSQPLDKQGNMTGNEYSCFVRCDVEKKKQQFFQSSLFALFCLSFMNCRNVQVKEMPENVKHRKRKKKAEPTDKQYTLVIRPMGKTRTERPAGRNESHDNSSPMFSRRGHFADYTKGKGLFGKIKGVFWFNSTVIGKKENGTIKKDYRIKP